MTGEEKLAQVREFCNSIGERTLWNPYDLACEIRDFIDGDAEGLPI